MSDQDVEAARAAAASMMDGFEEMGITDPKSDDNDDDDDDDGGEQVRAPSP